MATVRDLYATSGGNWVHEKEQALFDEVTALNGKASAFPVMETEGDGLERLFSTISPAPPRLRHAVDFGCRINAAELRDGSSLPAYSSGPPARLILSSAPARRIELLEGCSFTDIYIDVQPSH